MDSASYSENKKKEILADYKNVLSKEKLNEVNDNEINILLTKSVQNMRQERLKVVRKDLTTIMIWVRNTHTVSLSIPLVISIVFYLIYIYTHAIYLVAYDDNDGPK